VVFDQVCHLHARILSHQHQGQLQNYPITTSKYTVRSQPASPLREFTCHIGSHSVTCHPTEVTFPPSPQPKLVLDLATTKGCKAELNWLAGYILRRYTRPKTVTHPSLNRARRALTSFKRRTPLTTTPRRTLSDDFDRNCVSKTRNMKTRPTAMVRHDDNVRALSKDPVLCIVKLEVQPKSAGLHFATLAHHRTLSPCLLLHSQNNETIIIIIIINRFV